LEERRQQAVRLAEQAKQRVPFEDAERRKALDYLKGLEK
jgi:hypothetical protein